MCFCFSSCNNAIGGTERSYTGSSGNFVILSCVFSRYFVFSIPGSVIYLTGTANLAVNDTTFVSCMSTGMSGAIHFEASQSILFRVCGRSCYGYRGHLARIQCNNAKNNFADSVSLTNCSYTFNGNDPIVFLNGYQRIMNLNTSYNYAHHGSGFYSFNPNTLQCKYCSIIHNIAYGSICIHINSGSSTRSLEYSNIIENECPIAYGVVYIYSAIVTILRCHMADNFGLLLCSNSSTINIQSSVISHLSSPITYGSVIQFSVMYTTSIPTFITHYNTFYCPTFVIQTLHQKELPYFHNILHMTSILVQLFF